MIGPYSECFFNPATRGCSHQYGVSVICADCTVVALKILPIRRCQSPRHPQGRHERLQNDIMGKHAPTPLYSCFCASPNTAGFQKRSVPMLCTGIVCGLDTPMPGIYESHWSGMFLRISWILAPVINSINSCCYQNCHTGALGLAHKESSVRSQ